MYRMKKTLQYKEFKDGTYFMTRPEALLQEAIESLYKGKPQFS